MEATATETNLEHKEYAISNGWILKELTDKPLIWMAAILFSFLVIIAWLCYCARLFRSMSTGRESAYRDLVQSEFFKRWLIRDLYGVTYNPPSPENQNLESNE